MIPTPDLQPYGSKPHEVIHSVSRSDLNAILLDAAEATGRVTESSSDRDLERVDFDTSLLHFADGSSANRSTSSSVPTVPAPRCATPSPTRVRARSRPTGSTTPTRSSSWHRPPAASHRIDPHALHIWPRGEFMLIALANPEGDFTVTLFAPNETFDAPHRRRTEVDAFFAEHFADFAAMVPDLAEQYFENPTGRLGDACGPTAGTIDDRAVILGDAAHAIVPFHGQGMNAAMESARALDRHLRATPDDLAAAFAAYEAERKPDADAIARHGARQLHRDAGRGRRPRLPRQAGPGPRARATPSRPT